MTTHHRDQFADIDIAGIARVDIPHHEGKKLHVNQNVAST
jgi:hypothetical protein